MPRSVQDAIVKIEVVQGGKCVSRGTGCLVANGLVLTALHVVADRKQPSPVPYPGEIRLTFDHKHFFEASLHETCWDSTADWALLRCPDLPATLCSAPLGDMDQSVEELVKLDVKWWTRGFPDANPKGMTPGGKVRNRFEKLGDETVLQLFCEEAAAGQGAKVKGLSGSPVVVEGSVVGLLRFALMGENDRVEAGTLYACPIAAVVEAVNRIEPNLLPEPAPLERLQRPNFVLRVVPFVVLALVLVSLVFFKKSTDVRVDVHASQFSFVAGSSGDPTCDGVCNAFAPLPLSSFRILHAEPMILGPGSLEMAVDGADGSNAEIAWKPIESKGVVQISPADASSTIELEAVTLNSIDIQAGAKVTLTVPDDEPNALQLRAIGTSGIVGAIQIEESLLLSCTSCAANGFGQQFESAYFRFRGVRPRVISFAGKPDATVWLVAKEGNAREEGIVLESGPDSPDFTVTDGPTKTSTIADQSKIILPELDNKEIELHPSEFFLMKGPGQFLMTVEKLDKNLHVTLTGTASRLLTGPEEGSLRDQRPSVLEWIYRR